MYKNAACQIGTVTVSASGGGDRTIIPLLSDNAYSSVCISVTPQGNGPSWRHRVELYLDGVLKETNDYTTPTEKYSTQMIYKDQIFAPNVNMKARPDMRPKPLSDGWEPNVPGFHLVITNYEDGPRRFIVQSIFEMYVQTVCRRMQFD